MSLGAGRCNKAGGGDKEEGGAGRRLRRDDTRQTGIRCFQTEREWAGYTLLEIMGKVKGKKWVNYSVPVCFPILGQIKTTLTFPRGKMVHNRVNYTKCNIPP